MVAEVVSEVVVGVVVAFVEGVAQEAAEVALQEVAGVVVALGVEEDSRIALCTIIVLSIFHLQCHSEERLQQAFVCTVFCLALNLLVFKILNLILLQILKS